MRQKLDELSPRLWTDPELNNYINQSYYRHWQVMLDQGYRKTMAVAYLSLVGSQREVPLPEGFIKERLLEHAVGDVWYPCQYYERFDTQVGANSSAGATVGDYYSYAYSYLGDDIILEPTPQNNETDSLRLTYFFQPDELVSDSDEPDFPSLYHRLLVLDTVIQGKDKEEMTAGTGADIAPFIRDYNDLYNKFLDNISVQTVQRNYVEPWGVY